MKRPAFPFGDVARRADRSNVREHVGAALAQRLDVVDLFGLAAAQPASAEHRESQGKLGGLDRDDLAAAFLGSVLPLAFPVRGGVRSDSASGGGSVVVALGGVGGASFSHVLGSAAPAHGLQPVFAAGACGEFVERKVRLAAVAALGAHSTEFTTRKVA